MAAASTATGYSACISKWNGAQCKAIGSPRAFRIYVRDSRSASALGGVERPEAQRRAVRALSATHLMGDRWSPDLEVAVEDMSLTPDAARAVLTQAKGARSAHRRSLVRLAFLAPDIQAAILRGAQPASLSMEDLLRNDLPISWAAQRRVLRFGG